jgi:hypothetical protein
MRRACHVQVGKIDRQQRIRLRSSQLHCHGVDLARTAQAGHPGNGETGLARIKVRRVLFEHLLDIPDDSVGIKIRTVVEFHAGAQLENPLRLVVGIHCPLGGDAGDHHAGLVGR